MALPHDTLAAWLQAAAHQPLLQFLAIAAGTFVLEDAATVLAASATVSGTVPIPVALAALYAGIVLGDLGLYGLGALAARVPWARRWVPPDQLRRGRDWLGRHVFRVVLASRFLPGTRLPVYTACGFVGANLKRFALAAVVATLAWTSLLFTVSRVLSEAVSGFLGVWRWAGIAGLAAAVVLAGRMVATWRTRRH